MKKKKSQKYRLSSRKSYKLKVKNKMKKKLNKKKNKIYKTIIMKAKKTSLKMICDFIPFYIFMI